MESESINVLNVLGEIAKDLFLKIENYKKTNDMLKEPKKDVNAIQRVHNEIEILINTLVVEMKSQIDKYLLLSEAKSTSKSSPIKGGKSKVNPQKKPSKGGKSTKK